MAVSIPRDSAFKVLEPEMSYTSTSDYPHQNGAYSYGLCREPYFSCYQPMTGFGRMAWDYSVYSREPYYQTLLSLHAARGFASPAFFNPHSFKSLYGDEEKPNQSYIGLIGQAIMSSPENKMVLSDIYKWVLTHYAYFRNKGPGWKNSVRHNLSLNDCFIKAGRSPNGKGNYWAINPENYDDFRKGDFRRKRAQRRVRKYSNIADKTQNEDVSSTEEQTGPTQDATTNRAKLETVIPTTKGDGKIRTFDVENLLRVDRPE